MPPHGHIDPLCLSLAYIRTFIAHTSHPHAATIRSPVLGQGTCRPTQESQALSTVRDVIRRHRIVPDDVI
jgi:hypothetical protein